MKHLTNAILHTDSYKNSHFKFMNENTTDVFSYIEARKGAKFDSVVFFGLQIYLQDYLTKPITTAMINQAEAFITAHGLPFNRKGWEYIVKKHRGYLPIKICAVPEGTIVPINNVLVTVENTDPNCAWIANYVETALLRSSWYGSTVATQSYEFKKIITKYLELSGDPLLASWKLVDFGARGVSSFESAYIGGAAHLVNFMTTDNLVGIAATMDYYYAPSVTGFSIPASEHSVTTECGKDGELQFFSDAIETFLGEGKMLSLVSDTYSLKNAIKYFGVDLKDQLLKKGGTLVVRPDSGNPVDIVLFTVSELDKYFGHTVNEKGYKVLHPSVRVIQGDGISIDSIEKILENLTRNGYSADNVTFGSGGQLLQAVNRDTQRFAQKASHVITNGVPMDICKVPETDMTKASKAGRITLVKRDNDLITINEKDILETDIKMLQTVFIDGFCLNQITFDEVRKNVGTL